MKIPFSGIMRRCCQPAGLLLALSASTATIAEEQDLLSIARDNFQAADADGDSSLDPTEFRSLINANAESNIGRASTVKRFGAYDRAFKTADRNGDGSVAWSEIIATRGDR